MLDGPQIALHEVGLRSHCEQIQWARVYETASVRTDSEVAVDGGWLLRHASGGLVRLQVTADRPAASISVAPAIAAKEGSRRGRSQRRTVEGVQMRSFGEKHVAHAERANTCLRAHAVLVLTAPAWLPVSGSGSVDALDDNPQGFRNFVIAELL